MTLTPSTERFVGRVRELGELRVLADAIGGRDGSVVLVSGEPGIGKSSLINRARGYARQSGYIEHIGFCSDHEGAPPYWPWVQALRPYVEAADPKVLSHQLGVDAPLLAAVVPTIRQLLPDIPAEAEDLNSERARFRLFDASTQFLRRISHTTPVVLTLEDLHWADEASLRLFSFVSRQLEGTSMLLIGSYRPVDAEANLPLRRCIGEMAGNNRVLRVALEGWSPEETAQYLAATVPAELVATIAPEMQRLTEGTPMFVAEIARLLAAGGTQWSPGKRSALAIPLPHRISEAIERRLELLSQECRRVLTRAALVGHRFPYSLLESFEPVDSLVEALDEAERAGIVDADEDSLGHYAFHHELFRRALLESTTVVGRARQHLEVAEALEKLAGDDIDEHATAMARHLVQAGQFGDKEKLTRFARIAADHALSVYAYEQAREYYLHALNAVGEDSVTAEAADILYGIGRSSLSMFGFNLHERPLERAFEICEDLGLLPLGVKVALSLDHHSKASWVKRRALEMVEPGCPEHAVLLAQLALQLTFLGDNVDEAAALIGEAQSVAEAIGDPSLVAMITRVHARVLYNHGRWREALDLAERAVSLSNRIGDDHLCSEAYVRVGTIYLHTDRPNRGLEAGRRALHLATRSGDQWLIFWALFLRDTSLCEFGAFDDARALNDRVQSLIPRFFSVVGQRVELELHSGDSESAKRYLDQFTQIVDSGESAMSGGAPHWKAVGTFSLWAFLTGESAFIDKAHLAADLVLSEGTAGSTVRWLAYPGLARVLAMQGDPEAARRCYERLTDDYGDRFGLEYVLGIAAAAAGMRSEARAHLSSAWGRSTKSGKVLEQLETAYHFARLLMAEGSGEDLARARKVIGVSLHEARRRGMTLWVEKLGEIEADRSSAVDARDSAEVLSEREIEVVRLVAQGLTDRKIGDALFISPKTVSNHLTNVREKTACHNRAEVVRYATEHGLLAD